jgi:PIN domain nuclease of toxin-antitoxin system
MSVAVTDSHALIWYALGPTRKLGRRARALFAAAEAGRATIYVPALVLVEIAEAVRRGAIRTESGFSRWAERLLASRGFVGADLTPAVVVAAESLYAIPERGDRMIAATASHLDCPLLSNDPVMTRVPGLTTLW